MRIPESKSAFFINQNGIEASIYVMSSVEVRISELSEIRIYPDHLTDRKLMLQIWIPEYTNFRAFSPFFSSFSLLCSSSFSLFSSTMVYLFLVTFLYGKKSRKKIILGRSICPPMKQFKNHKENDENLWLYNRPKLRSFEAFITVIEISIFGFENSTLYAVYPLIFWVFNSG